MYTDLAKQALEEGSAWKLALAFVMVPKELENEAFPEDEGDARIWLDKAKAADPRWARHFRDLMLMYAAGGAEEIPGMEYYQSRGITRAWASKACRWACGDALRAEFLLVALPGDAAWMFLAEDEKGVPLVDAERKQGRIRFDPLDGDFESWGLDALERAVGRALSKNAGVWVDMPDQAKLSSRNLSARHEEKIERLRRHLLEAQKARLAWSCEAAEEDPVGLGAGRKPRL